MAQGRVRCAAKFGVYFRAEPFKHSPREVFWLVTFPLSLPGVGAGVLLCFIPIVGEFVIPDLLAGSDAMMIGQTLWLEFFTNKDWPVASAIGINTSGPMRPRLGFRQRRA